MSDSGLPEARLIDATTWPEAAEFAHTLTGQARAEDVDATLPTESRT